MDFVENQVSYRDGFYYRVAFPLQMPSMVILRLTGEVPDVTDPQRQKRVMISWQNHFPVDFLTSEGAILEQLWILTMNLEEHESAEWFRCRGKVWEKLQEHVDLAHE